MSHSWHKLHFYKLDAILVTKCIFQKNVVLNWYSLTKRNWKDLDVFWHKKLTLNVQISWFLTPLCHLSVTDIKKPFCNIWFFCKKKLVSTVWVSTSLSKSGYSQMTRMTPENSQMTLGWLNDKNDLTHKLLTHIIHITTRKVLKSPTLDPTS